MRLTWQLAALVLSAAVGVLGAPGPPSADALLGAPAAQLPMEARDAELELELEDEPSPPHTAALLGPTTILNGGKPFFADKDPVTGQLDLSAAKVEPAEPPPQDPGKRRIGAMTSLFILCPRPLCAPAPTPAHDAHALLQRTTTTRSTTALTARTRQGRAAGPTTWTRRAPSK